MPEKGNEVGRELKVLEKSWCELFAAEFQTRSDGREEVQTLGVDAGRAARPGGEFGES